MALSPAFSINATAQLNPASVALVDTSTGSDGNIVTRSVFLYNVDGSLYAGSPFSWDYSLPSITISPLTQDVALNVTVNFLDGGGGILYTSSQIYVFRGYSELFYYQLTQAQTSNPNIIQDTNYYNNKSQLRTEIDSAINAISTGSDVFGAQQCISRAVNMVQQHQIFFGL